MCYGHKAAYDITVGYITIQRGEMYRHRLFVAMKGREMQGREMQHSKTFSMVVSLDMSKKK